QPDALRVAGHDAALQVLRVPQRVHTGRDLTAERALVVPDVVDADRAVAAGPHDAGARLAVGARSAAPQPVVTAGDVAPAARVVRHPDVDAPRLQLAPQVVERPVGVEVADLVVLGRGVQLGELGVLAVVVQRRVGA